MGFQNFKNARETNGAVHTVSPIMKILIVSAAEAEVASLFHNDHEAEPICATPHKMGNTQPATTIKTENSTANVLQTIQCAKNDQKPWTCNFIGLKIESNKTIPMYSIDQARKTWEIILPSITYHTSIVKCRSFTSIKRLIQEKFLLGCVCYSQLKQR